MASLFLRGGLWYAKVKLWNASTGRFEWVQKAMHVSDKTAAAAIAGTLERASGTALDGQMSRAKAYALVQDVLRFAGVGDLLRAVPSLLDLGKEMAGAKDLAAGTAAKYWASVTRFEAWAGPVKAVRSLDLWTAGEFEDFYRFCLAELSVSTANDHLRFWRSVFSRAEKLGHLKGNPAGAVKSLMRDAVEKVPFSRGDMVLILRHLRAEGSDRSRSWLGFVLLGWHTGHRLQDLLSVGAADLSRDAGGALLTLQPKKRANHGGRKVVLPLPSYVAELAKVGFKSLHGGRNTGGKVSEEFVEILKAAGVDPMPVQQKARIVHLKSFHSFRHSMASRCLAAGISGETARLVTDHESEKVHRKYTHGEIAMLREALGKVRRK